VVFGHWARGGLVLRERVRGLDTGCVWGKQLTGWIAEEDRIVQVPARACYSPPSLPEDAGPGA
jgi:bis(5'-nucleosyl)-tetraphosphatase (symmetrical)